jgi:hypothetical protein
MRGDEILFSAYRPGFPGSTVVYSATPNTLKRVLGDAGRNSVVLTESGELYWSAPSRESSETSVDNCIRTSSLEGKTRTVAEWLAPGGAMFSSGQSAYYVDGEMNPSAWPAVSNSGLPRAMRIPVGYGAAAVSGDRLLLIRRLRTGRVTLHEVRLP